MTAICRRAGTSGGRRRFLAAGAVAAALLAASPAGAQLAGQPPQAAAVDPPPIARTVQRDGVSLQQAVMLASDRYEGRVVRAETRSRGGRRVHEIRILGDDGRVRIVRIDARTGRFVR